MNLWEWPQNEVNSGNKEFKNDKRCSYGTVQFEVNSNLPILFFSSQISLLIINDFLLEMQTFSSYRFPGLSKWR